MDFLESIRAMLTPGQDSGVSLPTRKALAAPDLYPPVAAPAPEKPRSDQGVGTGPLNAQEALMSGNPQVIKLLEARRKAGQGDFLSPAGRSASSLGAKPSAPKTGISSP